MNIENKSSEIFTKQVKPISPFKYFLMNLGESLLKLLLWVLSFVVSIFTALWSFVKTIGVGIYKCALGVYKFFRRKCHQFKYNDKFGRLSFVFFGTSALAHKQVVNGIMYLVFEIGYIILFALFGVSSVVKLGTLGTELPHFIPDPIDPMFEQLVLGDNSVLVLVFGLLWVISLGVFIYVWNRSINNGYSNYRILNFKKFEKYDVDAMKLSEKIDLEAKEAYANKVSKKEFSSKVAGEIEAYISSVQEKEQQEYSKYLLYGVVDHTYAYCNRLEKAQAKIAKREDKKARYVSTSRAKVEELVKAEEAKVAALDNSTLSEDEIIRAKEKSEARVETYKNKVMLKTNSLEQSIQKARNECAEVEKRYSHYVLTQHTINNDKFGKFNEFYKVVANRSIELKFYEHYFDFKAIYEENLDKAPEKNKSNAEEIARLEAECAIKIEKTNKTFDEIVAKKEELKAEIEKVKAEYKSTVQSIKAEAAPDAEQKLLEAKEILVDKTTRIMYQLNDLPSDKNVSALRKEEINESKRALDRDKKYLKTNHTGETLGREEVINSMIIEYNFEYNDAVRFTNILLDKNGFKSEEEINSTIEQIKTSIELYQNEHLDKYVGKPKSFIDQLKGLLNDNFHITILILPILGILLMSIIPLLFSILIAFTNYSKGHEPPTQLFTWVGFENFKNLFNPSADSIYKDLPQTLVATLSWTIIWAVAATFSNYILGIIVALLINKESIKLKKLWRTVFVMTIAVPQFVSLLSMRALLSDGGAIDVIWTQITGSALRFASTDKVELTKIIIILVNIWIGIPYTILSTTGILLNIPKDLYESAKVDGAGIVKQFTKITMPYILFVTGPYLITQFVGNINNFNVIFFLSNGKPTMAGNVLNVGQTDLLITFLYNLITSNSNPQYGIASTVGIVIFVICAFFSLIMYNRSGAIKEEDQFQ